MMSLLSLLAASAQVDGDWLISYMTKFLAGLAAIATAIFGGKRIGALQERKKLTGNVTVQAPFPTVTAQLQSPPHPSWDQHVALVAKVERMEGHLEDLRDDLGAQYKEILQSGREREDRLTDKLDAIARAWHSRVDTILQERPNGKTGK